MYGYSFSCSLESLNNRMEIERLKRGEQKYKAQAYKEDLFMRHLDRELERIERRRQERNR